VADEALPPRAPEPLSSSASQQACLVFFSPNWIEYRWLIGYTAPLQANGFVRCCGLASIFRAMFVAPFQFSSVMPVTKSFANRGGGSAFCRRMVRYTPSSAYSDSAKVCKAGSKSRGSVLQRRHIQ
jgi:hypothetical protein